MGSPTPSTAYQAARAALAGDGLATPKMTTGPVEALRMLLATRRGLIVAAQLLVTAGENPSAPMGKGVGSPSDRRLRQREASHHPPLDTR